MARMRGTHKKLTSRKRRKVFSSIMEIGEGVGNCIVLLKRGRLGEDCFFFLNRTKELIARRTAEVSPYDNENNDTLIKPGFLSSGVTAMR